MLQTTFLSVIAPNKQFLLELSVKQLLQPSFRWACLHYVELRQTTVYALLFQTPLTPGISSVTYPGAPNGLQAIHFFAPQSLIKIPGIKM